MKWLVQNNSKYALIKKFHWNEVEKAWNSLCVFKTLEIDDMQDVLHTSIIGKLNICSWKVHKLIVRLQIETFRQCYYAYYVILYCEMYD